MLGWTMAALEKLRGKAVSVCDLLEFAPAVGERSEREVARRFGVTRQAVKRRAARLAAGLKAEQAAVLARWLSPQ